MVEEEFIQEMHSFQSNSSENREGSHFSFEMQLLEDIMNLRKKLKELGEQIKVLSVGKDIKGNFARKSSGGARKCTDDA